MATYDKMTTTMNLHVDVLKCLWCIRFKDGLIGLNTFVYVSATIYDASGAVQLWWKDTQHRTVQDTRKIPHQKLQCTSSSFFVSEEKIQCSGI